MRLLLGVVAVCLALGGPGSAEAGDTSSSAKNVPGWEAVGRLNIAGRNMCTGALVAPNLVVTAAHCLFDQNTGRAVNPKTIQFEAGLSAGRAKASRSITKAVIHPGYQFRPQGQSQIGYDIAVLRLDRPIDPQKIVPFTMAARPEKGDAVGVISYTQLHANSPNLEQPCHVIARQSETLVMSCKVEFGASGAPVFAIRSGRAPRLVSVISAKAAMGNKRVSIGTTLDQSLQALMRRAG